MRFSTVALYLSCSALSFADLGCRSKASPVGSAPSPSADPRPAVSARQKFGSPIPPGDSIALSQVMERPDDFESRSVVVQGTVRRNCTRRGCWMELADGMEPDSPGCRVTFKDYGFFVPLDSAGSTAKVQGTVEVHVVSGPEVEHLENEGAKFAGKRPDGTAREVRMVASGVELWRGSG